MFLDAIFVLAPALTPLLLPVPLLLYGARNDRKLIAASPGVFGAIVYIATVLAAHWSRHPVHDTVIWLHGLASATPLLLLAPSVMALRNKWLSIVHVITLIGVVGSWVIGGVLLQGTS